MADLEADRSLLQTLYRGYRFGPSGPGTDDLLLVSFRLGMFYSRAALAVYVLHLKLYSVQGGIEEVGGGSSAAADQNTFCPRFPCPVLMT